MHFYHIKKDGLYLHIETVQHEDYQDYSDIYAMHTQQYVLKTEQEGAIKFSEQRECDRFLVTIGRKLKGFKEVKE